jgi:hypothetical protein
VNLQRLEKRQGIVRTFLADVQAADGLERDTTSSDPHVWLYAFKEVVPNNLADGSFLKGNPWGESNLAAEVTGVELVRVGGWRLDRSPTRQPRISMAAHCDITRPALR